MQIHFIASKGAAAQPKLCMISMCGRRSKKHEMAKKTSGTVTFSPQCPTFQPPKYFS